MIAAILKITQGRRDEQKSLFFSSKAANHDIVRTIHPTRTFDPSVAGPESRVSPLDITPLKS